MSTIRKISSIALSISTVAMLAGSVLPAGAATAADIQTQINALLAQIQALQAQLSGGTTGGTAYNYTRDLTVGSRGDDVTALQNWLMTQSSAQWPAGQAATGYFGPITRAALGRYQAAVGISPTAGYFGPKTRAYVASLAVGTPGVPGVPGVPVPAGAIVLALASDNPAGATLPKGASAVPVLKFTASGNGTLTDLTFKREGVGATADIASAGVYLYEGATRLTSGRSLNSTSHEVSFVNLALAVSGTRTLWLAVDVATGATAGNKNSFKLVSSAGTPSVSGSLMSNTFEMGGQSAGVATTTKVGSLSSSTVGAKNVQVSEFRLDVSGAEDVEVTSIAMTQGGSVSNTNLSNFVLKQNDVTVATAGAVGAKDLVTFAFISPFKIEKGQQKTFKVYADFSGSTKSGDQIKLYFDSAADVKATGKTYGFNVTTDITGMDTAAEVHTVELKGGDVTITFNGPISGDIARRGQDVQVFNFTIATKSAIEIRNWRFAASTSVLTAGKGFNDFKIWDTTSGSVITSAVDITTSTNQTFTDVYTMAAGASKVFKVTVDVDADNADGDTLTVKLSPFESNDIKNTENNQFVATSAIVPSATVSGNTMTTRAPSLDIQLSSAPSSQTLVQGSTGKTLVAFGFKAVADTIKVSTVKITASYTVGTLTSGEVTNLRLYDGETAVSDVESLNSSDLTATFDSMNVSIPGGTTKTLSVRGNISTDATNADVFHVKINSTSTDITATDSDGNSATITGATANSAGTVAVTIASVGDVTVVKAADDTETGAGVMLAGGERVLGKFRFTATNEDMTINKLHILIASSSVAIANTDSGTVVDDVPTVKLYDGANQIGSASGYNVNSTGASTSIAEVAGLGWVVPRDSSKTLTVKGVIPTIGQSGSGADFGTSVYVSVMAAGFEAQGATAKDTAITAATGLEKIVYKTEPKFTSVTAGTAKLTAGTIPVLKFKIKADGPDQIAWKQIQFKVTVTQASMTAVEAVPGLVVGNVGLKDITGGATTQLNIASAYSGTSTTTDAQNALGSPGGQTGYVGLLLNAENTITSGQEKEYELSLNFTGISGTVGLSTLVVQLHRTETTKSTGTVSGVRASISTPSDASPSFVWSDYSVAGHTDTEGSSAAGGNTSTADWANSYLLKGIPSNTITLTN